MGEKDVRVFWLFLLIHLRDKDFFLGNIYPKMQIAVRLGLIIFKKKKPNLYIFPGLVGVKLIFFSHFSSCFRVIGLIDLFSSSPISTFAV